MFLPTTARRQLVRVHERSVPAVGARRARVVGERPRFRSQGPRQAYHLHRVTVEGGSAGVAPADLEGSRPAPRVRGRGEALPRGSCPVGYEDAFLGGGEASLPLRRVGDELPGFIGDCRVQPVLLLLAHQRFQQRPGTAAINRLPGVCLACQASVLPAGPREREERERESERARENVT